MVIVLKVILFLVNKVLINQEGQTIRIQGTSRFDLLDLIHKAIYREGQFNYEYFRTKKIISYSCLKH